nr:MAG TPA: Protein of unknown function (DUF1376) [Caudoviricetes sp.]
MISFSFHIGDFAKKTSHLTHEERGMYLALLMKIYDSESPLPSDLKQVCRLICVRNADEMQTVSGLLDEFFILTDAGWINRRVSEEIERYKSKSEKARKSAETRWSKGVSAKQPQSEHDAESVQSKSERNANATENDSERYANASETHDERNANLNLNHLYNSLNAHDEFSTPLDHDENTTTDDTDFGDYCTGEQLQFDGQHVRMAQTTGLVLPDNELRLRFDLFRCYGANANSLKSKSEWLNAWRTWCQREKVQHAKPKTNSGHSGNAESKPRSESPTQRAMRLAQQAAERIANENGQGS